VEVDDDHHDEAPAGRPGAARTLRRSVRRRGNGTWRRLLAGLPTSERADLELDRVEDAAISSIANRTGWKHPVREQDRHALSVRMDAWYRAPLDDPEMMVSWVELVRSYPPGPDDEGCGLETFFSGWVLRRRTEPGKARVDLHARVTYCDRKDVLYMLPFGRLKSGGDWFWIYQLSGWDAEWYTVTRVDAVRPKTVAEFYGGGSQGCPR
jgi:hypothetical protein